MVLGEIGRPIERADIIERDSAALDGVSVEVIASRFDESEEDSEQPVAAAVDEDVEETSEPSMDDISQPESTAAGGWWSWLARLRPDGLATELS